jgi:hypothetical protein
MPQGVDAGHGERKLGAFPREEARQRTACVSIADECQFQTSIVAFGGVKG